MLSLTAEVRRVSIATTGNRVRELEITSYAELVLAPQAADIAHPAFSKLFVETEYLADVGAIVATWLGQFIGWYREGDTAGFVGAVVGAVIILAVHHALTGPRRD